MHHGKLMEMTEFQKIGQYKIYKNISTIIKISKYLKLYESLALYTAASSLGLILPNVSYIEDTLDVKYNPRESHDYSLDYFTIEVLENNFSISWDAADGGICYSTDDGETWSSPLSEDEIYGVNAGTKILFKGNTHFNTYFCGNDKKASFTINDKKFNVYGNILSLRLGDNFTANLTQEQITVIQGMAYDNLFKETYVVNAGNLILPNVTSLTNSSEGYRSMFEGCYFLETAPALPTTSLCADCYSYMFYNCTSLTTAPELPATTLDNSCYESMFEGCTSLIEAPALNATIMMSNCYKNMFKDCESLEVVPDLLSTSLASYCYESMFEGCMSLTEAQSILPSTGLANYCYKAMFKGCTSLETAPELPATILWNNCYEDMFYECGMLTYIKCLATNISATDCTTNWTYGVGWSAENYGTFVKNSSMSSWTTGDNGIPQDWTVENAS